MKTNDCEIREIKFPRKVCFIEIREIKFPRKMDFSPLAKLNSSEKKLVILLFSCSLIKGFHEVLYYLSEITSPCKIVFI